MVLISAGIMSVSLLRKNEPFFNIHEIVQEYRKLIRGSTIVFFILPLLFSVGLALLYTAGTRFYSEIGVILGIILSMLLASLSILCNYDFSEVRDEQQRKKGRDVVKTTINKDNDKCCVLRCINVRFSSFIRIGDNRSE